MVEAKRKPQGEKPREEIAEEVTFKGLWRPARIARMAIFIALSAVGALIKIPSPTGTVALDSSPGFFSAVAFGPLEGGIVVALGHVFTAATTGFPLGVPMHLYIAVQMAIYAAAFWFVSRKVHLIVGVIVATLLNGIVGAAAVIPFFGMGLFIALLVPLLVGSAVNVIIAAVAYYVVKRSKII